MQLKLYKTTDSDNVINKTLTGELSLDIFLKRDVDISNPELVLVSVAGYDFRDFNYCSIPDLNRFYFIRDITSLSSEVSKLSCECDVLETYKAQILLSEGSFRRKPIAGDYGPIDLELTGVENYFHHESNVEMEEETDSIFSVIRWSKGGEQQ